MRVVSWNLAKRGRETWDYLWTLDPDIALVQEAVLPTRLPEGYRVLWTEALPTAKWGSAVLSRLGDLELIWKEWRGGAMVIAQGSIPSIGAVSIGSVHARVKRDGVIRALRESFDAMRPHLRERFILGGDFNTARAAAEAWPKYGHGEFWSDLDTWGFRDSYYMVHGVEVQSFWRARLRTKLMDDHILTDAETAGLLKDCVLLDTPQIRALSDHGPVVADFALEVGD